MHNEIQYSQSETSNRDCYSRDYQGCTETLQSSTVLPVCRHLSTQNTWAKNKRTLVETFFKFSFIELPSSVALNDDYYKSVPSIHVKNTQHKFNIHLICSRF